MDDTIEYLNTDLGHSFMWVNAPIVYAAPRAQHRQGGPIELGMDPVCREHDEPAQGHVRRTLLTPRQR